jgi:N-acyl-D-amino-acid deacylase
MRRIGKIYIMVQVVQNMFYYLGFKQDSLKKFTGKTLAEVAKIRGTSPEETAMDLIVQDSTRVGVAYF